MHESIKEKIRERVHATVQTILENSDSIDTPNIKEVMCLYGKSGSLISKDVFFIYETEMIRHIEASAKKGFDITADDNGVIIKRNYGNGDYYIVEYSPIRERSATL
jgi:hypothetical protein